MPAGSCRGIYSQSHGRCQPLHHTCKKGDNYAQGHSVSPLHLGRASTILSSSKQACLLVVGCVGFFCLLTGTGEGNLSGKDTVLNYLGFVSFYPFLFND